MNSQHSNSPEQQAYREAGHAVMSYLIRNGFTNKYVPISRSDSLHEFKQLTIDGENIDWAKVTSNLGSLVTVPQVLLAGYIAGAIKYNMIEDVLPRKSKLIEEARSWLRGYVEEYYTDDFIKRDKYTTSLLMEVFAYVKEKVETHWESVDALANALLQQKTLSEEKAFEIIEREIPEYLRINAEIELSRTTTEKLAEILNQEKDRKSTAKRIIKKRLWWQFWI